MFRREESTHDFAFLAGVILGAIAGVLVAMVLTPISGAEARNKLREHSGDLDVVKAKAVDAAGTAKERVGPVREKAAGVAATAKQKVEPVKGRAMELAAKSPLPIGNSTGGELVETSEELAAQADEVVGETAANNGIVAG